MNYEKRIPLLLTDEQKRLLEEANESHLHTSLADTAVSPNNPKLYDKRAKTKLEILTKELEAILDTPNKNACLWFSGGADSRLLLEVMLKIGKNFSILRFDDGWSKAQKRIVDELIIKYNLKVYAYPPMSYMLVGKENQISLIARYGIDQKGNTMPVVRDLIDGKNCGLELKLQKARYRAPIEFDIHISGAKFEDSHYTVEKVLSEKSYRIGMKKFYEPLADWTKPQIYEALRLLGVRYLLPSDEEDTGNISVCHNCFKSSRAFCPKVNEEIDGVKWDMTENLKIFQMSVS